MTWYWVVLVVVLSAGGGYMVAALMFIAKASDVDRLQHQLVEVVEQRPVWESTLAAVLADMPRHYWLGVGCAHCADGVRWSARVDWFIHLDGYTAVGMPTPEAHDVAPVLVVRAQRRAR